VPQRGQAGEFGVDLRDAAADERLGVAAEAAATVQDRQQLGDLPQRQAEALGVLDERSRSVAAGSYWR
jgi:hypothetical protein